MGAVMPATTDSECVVLVETPDHAPYSDAYDWEPAAVTETEPDR